MTKLIIAGSRDFVLTVPQFDWLILKQAKIVIKDINEVVSGRAYGIDQAGEEWAKAHNIPVEPFPYLKQHGKRGGILRNIEMGKYADMLLAFQNNESKGTKHMIEWMIEAKKPAIVFKFKDTVYQNAQYFT